MLRLFLGCVLVYPLFLVELFVDILRLEPIVIDRC
jgi:hypothetical protein